ncbi:hypothetical protein QBC35DRAFT_200197 [Podospora australis]|uniref:PWWP domain-containing protein n=1 Tax=Podospora australis TaxID=1536484 RepID=A0AAN6X2B2_9PEZI|nr:hypothetical protein QBC35DRAFT_200197 [Podospora australis]
MSRENSPSATAAESAPPSIERKEDATIAAPAEDLKKAVAAETKAATESGSTAVEPSSDKTAKASEKPAEQSEEKSDVEMTDADAQDNTAPKVEDAVKATEPESIKDQEAVDDAATDAKDDKAAPSSAASSSAAKRKSISGAAADKGKKLNRKASKPRILHMDAQPGEHYYVKLKGFPQWPVIICDEEMLPESLLKSRPVTARRQDGTYRDDYADGAKKAADRTFPVMYLHTNEFGWVPNSDLIDLDPSTVLDIKMDKMRKDLQAAHYLAAENHPLSYYKDLLQQYQEELIEKEKLKAAKAAAAATPKAKKSKSAAPASDDDVEMEDAPEDESVTKEKKAKKRKADEPAETPTRTDSVKKPKIKLTNNAAKNAANGASSTPAKSAKPAVTEAKSTKSKAKKTGEEKKAEKEATPKEPELTPKEKHDRKEKEVLFLRHKLQKGLLTRDQEPKESEMEMMSDYITKLEQFPDLEVSIIRVTKINKVLKAILKLEKIPKESEYRFRARSQVLLDKWNKLLAADPGATEAKPANGVNGTAAKTNGVNKESSKPAEPAKPTEEVKEEAVKEESKDEPKASDEAEEKAETTPDVAEKPAAAEVRDLVYASTN